jgi:hypothetical protein
MESKVLTPGQLERRRAKGRRWYARNRDKKLAYCSEWRANNPDKVKTRWQNWHANNRKEYNEKRRIYMSEQRLLFPLKERAHWIVSNAIKSGKLKRKPCLICGNEKTHAHHKDYSKPLRITWLCPLHHHQQHRKN